MTRRTVGERTISVTPALLRRWPLPQPADGGGKEARGQVLIVAGSAEMPGGAVLCAEAALRAGAGKLQIATTESAAPLVAGCVPEARVVSLPETRAGALSTAAGEILLRLSERADAVAVGPGMIAAQGVARVLATWLMAAPAIPVVMDAAALDALETAGHDPTARAARLIVPPHALEAARLLGLSPEAVNADPARTARELALRYRTVALMKGATSIIVDGADPSICYANRNGNPGLGTSGSGDTLAGMIAGLAARGASPLQATVWATYLHAAAGDVLARRTGMLGYLARELPPEVPMLMNALTPAVPASTSARRR